MVQNELYTFPQDDGCQMQIQNFAPLPCKTLGMFAMHQVGIFPHR